MFIIKVGGIRKKNPISQYLPHTYKSQYLFRINIANCPDGSAFELYLVFKHKTTGNAMICLEILERYLFH